MRVAVPVQEQRDVVVVGRQLLEGVPLLRAAARRFAAAAAATQPLPSHVPLLATSLLEETMQVTVLANQFRHDLFLHPTDPTVKTLLLT